MDINECTFSEMVKVYISDFSKVSGKRYTQGSISDSINISRKEFCMGLNKDIEDIPYKVLYGLYGYINIFMNPITLEDTNKKNYIISLYTRILNDITCELYHRESNREFLNSNIPPRQR